MKLCGGEFKRGEGNCGIVARLLVVCVAVGGFACSVSCLGACDYFVWEPRTPPSGVEDTRPDRLLNVSIATLGLFKYDFDYEGCRDIPDDLDQLSGWFTSAQVGCSLAVIVSAAGLALLLVDLILCRFPCSRLLISMLFLVAFISHALTFLVFVAPICDPNYVNGPFPCSPSTGTWLSVSACVLFLISSVLACCVPKPLPIFVRVKKSLENDETDGCCVICKKKPKDDEEKGDMEQAPDVEKGTAVVAAGGVVEKEPVSQTAEELQADQTHAAVAADLAAVRRGKQDEIEKQLELLTKYKDHLSEEEYDEKVTALIRALPDPTTYDAFTKTAGILPPEAEEGIDDEEEGQEEDETKEQEEEEVEEEEKKSLGQKMVAPVTAVGSAMGSAFKGAKDTVTGSKNKEPKQGESK